MLTETVVTAILTASVTGAGLVIAVYALMSPISKRIFEDRIERLRRKKEQFEKIKRDISAEKPEGLKQLKTLADEIRQIRTFPRYLGPLVLLTFSFYIITITVCLSWIGSSSRELVPDQVVTYMFFASTALFLVVGVFSILDVYGAMKGEFEQMKKEKEEIEKAGKDTDKLRKEVDKILARLAKEES